MRPLTLIFTPATSHTHFHAFHFHRGGAKCPKLPLALCPRLWDERHVPLHEPEDVEIWGRGLSRTDHWPRYLLFAQITVTHRSLAQVLAVPTDHWPRYLLFAQITVTHRSLSHTDHCHAQITGPGICCLHRSLSRTDHWPRYLLLASFGLPTFSKHTKCIALARRLA